MRRVLTVSAILLSSCITVKPAETPAPVVVGPTIHFVGVEPGQNQLYACAFIGEDTSELTCMDLQSYLIRLQELSEPSKKEL